MTLYNHEDYILWFKQQGHLTLHSFHAVTSQIWHLITTCCTIFLFINYCSDKLRPKFLAIFRELIICATFFQIIWQKFLQRPNENEVHPLYCSVATTHTSFADKAAGVWSSVFIRFRGLSSTALYIHGSYISLWMCVGDRIVSLSWSFSPVVFYRVGQK